MNKPRKPAPAGAAKPPIGWIKDMIETQLGETPDYQIRSEVEALIHRVNHELGVIQQKFRQGLRGAKG